jgi:hypothetical protein
MNDEIILKTAETAQKCLIRVKGKEYNKYRLLGRLCEFIIIFWISVELFLETLIEI